MLIAIIIVINTVIMASEHHPMTQEHENFLDSTNLIVTIIFTIEMIMKLIGLG